MDDSHHDDRPGLGVFRDVAIEHSPLSALDEFLVHSAPLPVRVPTTTDARAYDRLWFAMQDHGGELYVVMGMGFYPNLNTADAFAMVVHRGQQRYIHSHRPLGSNRMDLTVGPIRFRVVEAFKQWRLELLPNAYGFSFSVDWFDTKRAVFHQFGMGGGLEPRGGMRGGDVAAGYESFGRTEGRIEIGGETFHFDAQTSGGSRDHHWGTRDGVGGPDLSRSGLGPTGTNPSCGQWVEFENWSIWGQRDLRPIGSPARGAGSYVDIDRRLAFDPETKIFKEAIIRNRLSDGTVKELHYRRIGNQIAFLRCGGYGSRSGGTPDGNIWHGMPVGDLTGGGAFDLNDPKVQISLMGLQDHLCEVSCGTEKTIGIFEPLEPEAFEAYQSGRRGYRFLS